MGELSANIIMNLKHESNESKSHPDSEEVSKLFLEYNQLKYENLLSRFQSRIRYHIRALPLFFHVNKNLLPGYVNNSVPCTVYNYIPDAETIDYARSFNSKFDYDYNSPAPEHSIEAIYIQDNLKSGKIILWVIYNKNLENFDVELLREKTSYVCKWLESIKIKIEHHVVTADNMAIAYWGNKYNSIHPDKSIFLDDFYAESILVAGKSPAWWLVSPDHEDMYEQLINDIKTNDEEKYEDIIDFGSIANARPQDYLASAIINLMNIKQCPEESWLNILSLCHKLEASPSLDCSSHRIKIKIYSGITECIQYQDIYCSIINHITNTIYGRDKIIVISRILKTISHKHRNNQLTLNIYEQLLSGQYNTDLQNTNTNKLAYEYIPATGVIFDLIKNAFQWLIKKIESINPGIIGPGSGIETITNNLIRQIESKNGYIPITNINPVKTIEPYDICLQHNTSHNRNNWSLFIIDYERNSYELRHDNNPISLVAWAVFNRIIDNKTRISVICPYLSIKQIHIADIVTILLSYLPDLISSDISLETYTEAETPEKDILIFNESKSANSNTDKLIHIYRFTITNYGEVIFNEYNGIDGFFTFVCESLSSDIKSGKKQHTVSMHNINSSLGNTFINEARNVYDKVSHFIFGMKCDYTHFIDIINDRYYAVVRNNDKLTSYNDINNVYPEEYFKYTGKNVLMYFSADIQNNKLLNYLYKNNVYGYLQVFYRINENISHIYILDENGILTRFSQPFHDRQSFLNQWLMFLYNTRNRIKSINKQDSSLPNIEICELMYNNYDRLVKTHLNSAMLPSDGRYFDLKVTICEDKGAQSIALKCDGMEFTSAEYGNEIFDELKKYLAKNSRIGSSNPIYLTDVETPLSLLNIKDVNELHIRDYIKYKRNIEKRLNKIINKF
ncbi:MAG TPA: hypothetical protein VIQ03_08755 [Gammaproteobacteria bacterium]